MFHNVSLIEGASFQDDRGKIRFINDFLMHEIKRMYIIEHSDTSIVRAWQAHKKEQKWFFAIKGSFEIKLVAPDNWTTPDRNLPIQSIILDSDDNKVLHIPGGFANGLKALEGDSKLFVFSDTDLNDSARDDFRFEKDYWNCW